MSLVLGNAFLVSVAQAVSTWAKLCKLLGTHWLAFAQAASGLNQAPSEEERNMVLAAQKNPKHFRFIYEIYFDRIFLYIHRRVKDEVVADDLTSQTFYLAMVHIRSFKFQGVHFSSWLYKIATNELNMYFRKHAQQTRHISLSTAAIEVLCKETESDFNEERIAMLCKALERLLPEELQLIEWRFFEACSFREIGYRLEITEANAKVKTYRLLDKLKEMLTAFK